jgi:hypothetical protein
MDQERRSWNAWDVPFFGATAVTRPAEPRTAAPRGPAVLSFAGDGFRSADRVWAVLIGLGGIVAGAAAVVGFFILSFVLSFGSEPSRTERTVAFGFGAAIALGGLVLAVVVYRHAGVASALRVSAGHVEIGYRAFRAPLVVPREAVRVVSIDDAPVILFTKNERFPIHGRLPERVFADALDNMPRRPWEELDPDASLGPLASAVPGGAIPPWRPAHLWSGDGSSLPFLRLGPGDVPNVAILFEGRIATPRPPWWLPFTASSRRAPLFMGGRKVSGVLVRLRRAADAADAFAAWGVVRDVTADDVLAQGLLVAKPLRGWRVIAYAGLLAGPFVIQLVLRLVTR